MLERGLDPTESAEEMANAFGKVFAHVSESLSKQSNRAKLLKDHVRKVAEKHGLGELPTKYITIPSLDAETLGLAPGENVVLAGLTSHGKTMIAMQMAHEAASRGVSVLRPEC